VGRRRGICGDMSLVRRIARPMLASIFLSGGWDSVLHPEAKAEPAGPIAGPIRRLPGLAEVDPVTLVRLNGAVMVGAGALLAMGRFPRLAAFTLAGTLVPTTLAGHRFWEYEDPGQRQLQRVQLLKNVSLLGGLLIAAGDTGGKPSLGWRLRHASEHAQAAASRSRRQVRRGALTTTRQVRREAKHVRREARLAARGARARLPM
jgi:putative oxidoreductase